MNYQEAIDYILSTPKFTKKNDLRNTEALLAQLGNPLENQKIIHVAGTNGKGSVCAYLSSILEGAGYCTGLFTSPHLIKINERFCIHQIPVEDEEFLNAFTIVYKAVEHIIDKGYQHPSFFEMIFAIGAVIFSKHRVDYVILEAGMGGRLDATNCIKNPCLAIITSISLDHTAYLGNTIEKIALDKAGIIKTGCPLLFDGEANEVKQVMIRKADEKNAPYWMFTGKKYEISQKGSKTIDFSLHSGYYENTTFTVSSMAEYQVRNAGLAITAAGILFEGKPIPSRIIRNAVAQTHFQGRMEEVLPDVYLDGAHNLAGIEAFCQAALKIKDKRPTVLLFSVVADKDYDSMFCRLFEMLTIDVLILVKMESVRGLAAEEMERLARIYSRGCRILTAQDVKAALNIGTALKEEGVLFCAGSLYLIGEIKKYLKEGKDD